jgi:hypothetical protein
VSNRLEAVTKIKKNKIYLLIVVAVSSDGNIIQKEAEDKLGYKNLSI